MYVYIIVQLAQMDVVMYDSHIFYFSSTVNSCIDALTIYGKHSSSIMKDLLFDFLIQNTRLSNIK